MRKRGKIKNPCKICFQTVTAKNGLRCLGACQKWAHFKCLNYTPGKIKDIKAGLIKVNCPCPNCHDHPKDEYAHKPYLCGKKKCPANLPFKCEVSTCPINNPSGSTQTDIETYDCPADCPSISSIGKVIERVPERQPKEHSEHHNQEIMTESRLDIKLNLVESQKSSHCCSPQACYPKKSPPHAMPNDLRSQNDCPLQPMPPMPNASKQSSLEHGPQQYCPTKPRPETPCPITPPPLNQNTQRQYSPCPAHTNQSNQRMPYPSKRQPNPDDYPIRPPQPHLASSPLSRPHTPPTIRPNECWLGKKRAACPTCCSPHDPMPQKCCSKLPLLGAIDTNDKKCCEKSSVYANNTQDKKCSHLSFDTHCKKSLTLVCSSGQSQLGQVMTQEHDALKSRSYCEIPQYTQCSRGDKLCSTSISDSAITVSTTRSRLSCKMEQLCTTIGEFSEQFKELMCRMMAALDKCR